MRVQTGIVGLDRLLGGGFHSHALNLVYGEAATGKTTLSLTLVFHHLSRVLAAKAVYLDVDNKLSITRLEQIAGPRREVLRRLHLFTPESYRMQGDAFEQLPQFTSGDLLLVDSITGLYRGEVEGAEKTFIANKELNRQLGYLSEIAKVTGLTVVLTGQVRSGFDSPRVEPVAERLLRYWSETVLRLETTANPGQRLAVLEKPAGARVPLVLAIDESGMVMRR